MTKCECCGQFFTPDKRVFKRQKACRKEECRKAIKLKAQKSWKDNNPEYAKNHYRDYIIPWRQKKRGEVLSLNTGIKDESRTKVIKDEIPLSNAMLELVLLIPADEAGMMAGMIKDEIRLRKVDTHRFAAYG